MHISVCLVVKTDLLAIKLKSATASVYLIVFGEKTVTVNVL